MSDEQVRHVKAFVTFDDAVETRNADGEKAIRLRGYASVFDSQSERMGDMVETIDRGAFDKVLASDPDVRYLLNHGGMPLGRTKSGTLRLSVDERGLAFEVDLDPRQTTARDHAYAVERGDVDQMSFGFVIGAEERMDDTPEGLQHYRVTEVSRLLEISAVTFPAYQATSVEAERLEDDADEDSDEHDDDGDVCEECGEAMRECRCGAHRAHDIARERLRRRQELRRLS